MSRDYGELRARAQDGSLSAEEIVDIIYDLADAENEVEALRDEVADLRDEVDELEWRVNELECEAE